MECAVLLNALMYWILTEIPFESDEAKHSIINSVAKVTHGFVPADLQNLCRQVVLSLVKREAELGDSGKVVS